MPAWQARRCDSGNTGYLPVAIKPPLELLWTAKVPWCQSTGVSDGQRLALATEKQDVLCLDLGDGRETWRFAAKTRAAFASNLCGIDETCVYYRNEKTLFALDKQGGTPLWRTDTPELVYERIHYPLAGGYLGLSQVGISTKTGKVVVVYGTDAGAPVQVCAGQGRVWCSGFRKKARRNKTYLERHVLASGKRDLLVANAGPESLDPCGFILSNNLLMHSASCGGKGCIVLRDARTGRTVRTLEETCFSAKCYADARLVFHSILGSTLDKWRRGPLVCYDAGTGAKLWERGDEFLREDSYPPDPIATKGYIWSSYRAPDEKGRVRTYLVASAADSGKVAWRTPFPALCYCELLATEKHIIAIGFSGSEGNGVVFCFGRADGRTPTAKPARSEPKPRGKGRKPVRWSAKGAYDIGGRRSLVLRPAAKSRSVCLREPGGKERELLALSGAGVFVEDLDVHSEAGTAILKPSLGKSGEQELYVFDGSAVHALPLGDEVVSCIAVAISPDGKRAAASFTFRDEPGDAQVRVFDIAAHKEVARVPLEDEAILAANLFWRSPDTLQFTNVNPGHETYEETFEVGL